MSGFGDSAVPHDSKEVSMEKTEASEVHSPPEDITVEDSSRRVRFLEQELEHKNGIIKDQENMIISLQRSVENSKRLTEKQNIALEDLRIQMQLLQMQNIELENQCMAQNRGGKGVYAVYGVESPTVPPREHRGRGVGGGSATTSERATSPSAQQFHKRTISSSLPISPPPRLSVSPGDYCESVSMGSSLCDSSAGMSDEEAEEMIGIIISSPRQMESKAIAKDFVGVADEKAVEDGSESGNDRNGNKSKDSSASSDLDKKESVKSKAMALLMQELKEERIVRVRLQKEVDWYALGLPSTILDLSIQVDLTIGDLATKLTNYLKETIPNDHAGELSLILDCFKLVELTTSKDVKKETKKGPAVAEVHVLEVTDPLSRFFVGEKNANTIYFAKILKASSSAMAEKEVKAKAPLTAEQIKEAEEEMERENAVVLKKNHLLVKLELDPSIDWDRLGVRPSKLYLPIHKKGTVKALRMFAMEELYGRVPKEFHETVYQQIKNFVVMSHEGDDTHRIVPLEESILDFAKNDTQMGKYYGMLSYCETTLTTDFSGKKRVLESGDVYVTRVTVQLSNKDFNWEEVGIPSLKVDLMISEEMKTLELRHVLWQKLYDIIPKQRYEELFTASKSLCLAERGADDSMRVLHKDEYVDKYRLGGGESGCLWYTEVKGRFTIKVDYSAAHVTLKQALRVTCKVTDPSFDNVVVKNYKGKLQLIIRPKRGLESSRKQVIKNFMPIETEPGTLQCLLRLTKPSLYELMVTDDGQYIQDKWMQVECTTE